MTEHRVKDRVRGLLAGTQQGNEAAEQPDVSADPAVPSQALHVLTLAQRTADEYVANARQQAEKIHADAREAAEQTARGAETHAHEVRQQVDKVLTDARAAAERMVREARARAQQIERDAGQILSDAQARADAIAADAQADADELKSQAQQRYDDVVGGLAAKREDLQQQIESLEQFDHEYRARLTSFMQSQLRALWVEQPEPPGDVAQPDSPPAGTDAPARRRSVATTA